MALSLVTAPVAEPLLVQEAIDHLRIDGSTDAAYVFTLIRAARDQAEAATKRALMRQTWKLLLDGLPASGVVYLPKPPLASVTHVKYYDTAGVLQTWSSSLYTVDAGSEPGRLYPAYGGIWPSYRAQPNAIEIQFVCGYATADLIPASILHGLRLVLGHLYENREEVGYLTPSRLPAGAASLFSSYEVMLPSCA